MKRALTGFALLSFLMQISSASIAGDWKRYCMAVAESAESIMTARQRGVSMMAVKESKSADREQPKLTNEHNSLILRAYDKPVHTVETMQKRSIGNFRDEAYLACAKAFRKSNRS